MFRSMVDTHYARNRLRLDIMPQLLAINPAAAAHIARTADILRAENVSSPLSCRRNLRAC